MLGIDETRDSASFLNLSHHMKGNRRLTGRFRSVDLHDASFGNTALSERNVKAQRSGGNSLHVHIRTVLAKTHDRALAVLLLNLAQCRIQRAQLV